VVAMKDEKGKSLLEGGDHLLARHKEFLQIIKRGAEFTEEVLKENERLRFRVAELEARNGATGHDGGLVRELMDKVKRLEEEREVLLNRFQEVEAENKDFASRYVQIENENNNLLNIYVASYQLHSTLDFQEVLQIITEIILNFVGAESFAVGMVQEGGEALRLLAVEGIERERLGAVRGDAGIVGQVLKSGDPYFAASFDDIQPIDGSAPRICVPLKIKDQTIGVILIYRFLQQKKQLAPVDHELFTLLAGHAATAIFAAKLYTDSKRKLNTIQGFIDLMTS
jgi:hypothetical protein